MLRVSFNSLAIGREADSFGPPENGRLSLPSLLSKDYVGRSLMIEGGASVISTFLASGLVDLVVITIAPVLVGDGVSMLSEGVSASAPNEVGLSR